jgi:hypothetical protein
MISHIAFSPDGRRVLTGAEGGPLLLWDGRTGAQIAKFEERSYQVSALCFSPDGGTILLGEVNKGASLIDAGSSELLQKLGDGSGGVQDACFSPDGRLVASAEDTLVRVWDRESGELLAEIEGHKDRLRRVRFSPDGQWILSAGDGGTARIWELPAWGAEALLAVAGERLRRAFTEEECQAFFGDDPQSCPRTWADLFA